jgi:hypothetical protein
MDFDTSVVLSENAVLNVVSPLASFDFSAKVLSALPEGVKAADLGCGRILVDYSTMLQTRYVLCDIYEEDGGEDGTFRYRIVVKSGKKSSRICDALIGLLFILCFWTAGKWFTDGFQVLPVVLSALTGIVGLLVLMKVSRFGKAQAEAVSSALKCALGCSSE